MPRYLLYLVYLWNVYRYLPILSNTSLDPYYSFILLNSNSINNFWQFIKRCSEILWNSLISSCPWSFHKITCYDIRPVRISYQFWKLIYRNIVLLLEASTLLIISSRYILVLKNNIHQYSKVIGNSDRPNCWFWKPDVQTELELSDF